MSAFKTYFIVVSFSIILPLICAETYLRFFRSGWLIMYTDERNLSYKYDSNLGWFPKENHLQTYVLSTTFKAIHNSMGFRDIEHTQTKSKPRIMILGDSFVWGYDVNQEDRFTDKLQQKLPVYEILNLGVSGYGTDQEYLLLQKYFDYYKPDIVFLVFCADNDIFDNSTNFRYDNYFKPYFIVEKDQLTLKGVPVNKSISYYHTEHPFLFKSYLVRAIFKIYLGYSKIKIEVPDPTKPLLKTINSFVINKQAKFYVGMQKNNADIETFLKQDNIAFVDLSNDKIFKTLGFHWTPEGHTIVAEKIFKFLTEQEIEIPKTK